MPNPDDATGLPDSRARLEILGRLISTTFKNQRLLTKAELLDRISPAEREMVEWFYQAKPRQFGLNLPFYGWQEAVSPGEFIKLKRYLPSLKGRRVLDIQYVPWQIHAAFLDMKQQLVTDTGGQIRLSSAYRSPAFQVLVLSYNVRRDNFDLPATLSRVTLPGYSEHGLISNGAIDIQLAKQVYVRADRVSAFAESDEYAWLIEHAASFGFTLSYPAGNSYGVPFEPWHWRYTSPKTA